MRVRSEIRCFGSKKVGFVALQQHPSVCGPPESEYRRLRPAWTAGPGSAAFATGSDWRLAAEPLLPPSTFGGGRGDGFIVLWCGVRTDDHALQLRLLG